MVRIGAAARRTGISRSSRSRIATRWRLTTGRRADTERSIRGTEFCVRAHERGVKRMASRRPVLITGGAGYIGSHVVRLLHEAG